MQTPFGDSDSQWSPDGRWLAYASSETGRQEVYVQPFPVSGARWQVSSAGGRQPMWRRDGQELSFVNQAKKFYAVDIRAGTTFEFGTPQLLFDMPTNVNSTNHSYAPSRDGQRFLVNRLLDAGQSPINVVINWTADLNKPEQESTQK